MASHEWLLLLLALASEVLGTIGGFGSSTFFVPVATLLEDLTTVLLLTSILHVASNTSKLILFRKAIRWDLMKTLVLPAVVATAIGAVGAKFVPVSLNKVFLGAFLITISTWFLLKPHLVIRRGVRLLTALSGFFTGLFGTGGALRGLVLTAARLEKNEFVATSAALDFGGDALRLMIYIWFGFKLDGHLFYIAPLILIAILGSWVGRYVLGKIPQEHFRYFVLGMIWITGAMLIAKTAMGE